LELSDANEILRSEMEMPEFIKKKQNIKDKEEEEEEEKEDAPGSRNYDYLFVSD
jgi:hypothetical protein